MSFFAGQYGPIQLPSRCPRSLTGPSLPSEPIVNADSQQASQERYQFDEAGALLSTQLPLPRKSGKVRDLYDLGDRFLVVSTDRISAFDYILPCGIPDKGKLLTQMSRFWVEFLNVRHHLISCEIPAEISEQFDTTPLTDRIMVVEKASVIPFECVARGYLEGSGWREYQATEMICGEKLPPGLVQCSKLPEAIYTPATKAEEGHDENVPLQRMITDVGESLANDLKQRTLEIYQKAEAHAASRGIIIADTKFEFGHVGDEIVLIDEVLTPDSSRFWDASVYTPGHAQPSYDKQFVREWLAASDWDLNSPPPVLPNDIIAQTAAKYKEAFDRLTS